MFLPLLGADEKVTGKLLNILRTIIFPSANRKNNS